MLYMRQEPDTNRTLDARMALLTTISRPQKRNQNILEISKQNHVCRASACLCKNAHATRKSETAWQ
jgi:hypothetical protein